MAIQIIRQLLDDLNSNNINYCHWKSNEHLEASVNGDTDLDVLFDNSQQEQVVEILKRNKFHLFESVWYRKYKGIVDYIGFDKDTGKIVHVHTHFSLDIGEVGIKSYRLPWENLILQKREFDSVYGIYKSSPEIEYLLLVVRTAFKHDLVDRQSNQKIAKHFEKEAAWLHNQINIEKLKLISLELLGHDMTVLVEKIRLIESYDEFLFLALKKLLKPYFASQRILSPQRVNYLKLVHFIKRLQNKWYKLLRLPIKTSRRGLPKEGVIVCLMGSDGAGKSTQTKEITRELSKKVDVLFMYMGSGVGSKSFQRKIIDNIFKIAAKKRNSSKKKQEGGECVKKVTKKSFFKEFVTSIRAVSLAYEKKRKLKYIAKEKKAGKIIICDRYPQTKILGYNDGPRLYENIKSTNFILRTMAKYEFSCYELAQKIYPDLVVKLTGKIEVLHSRRPEMTKEEITKKQEGIINLPFNNPTKIVVLDIDKPINRIKGEILDALSQEIR